MLDLTWTESGSNRSLLGIIIICVLVSGIIRSGPTQKVTSRINCRFHLFFKLTIIISAAQCVRDGISYVYSWKCPPPLFPYSIAFVLPYADVRSCGRGRQNYGCPLLSLVMSQLQLLQYSFFILGQAK